MEFQNHLKISKLKNYSEATIKTRKLYFSSTELNKNIKTPEIYAHIASKAIKYIKNHLDDLKSEIAMNTKKLLRTFLCCVAHASHYTQEL